MAEFVEGYERLANIQPSVSIFGSARLGPENPYYQHAVAVARALSDAGFSIVTGGGPGIMEAANKGGTEGLSLTVGLNIELPREEYANNFQDISLRFRHFFSRKVMFVKYASAYVVLPGGFGTLDELAEILALIQTNKSRRIPIVLVCKPFWEGLLQWFQTTLIQEKVIDASDMELMTIIEEPEDIVKHIQDFYADRGHYSLTDKEEEIMAGL